MQCKMLSLIIAAALCSAGGIAAAQTSGSSGAQGSSRADLSGAKVGHSGSCRYRTRAFTRFFFRQLHKAKSLRARLSGAFFPSGT